MCGILEYLKRQTIFFPKNLQYKTFVENLNVKNLKNYSKNKEIKLKFLNSNSNYQQRQLIESKTYRLISKCFVWKLGLHGIFDHYFTLNVLDFDLAADTLWIILFSWSCLILINVFFRLKIPNPIKMFNLFIVN
jgi:hypothetical protein